ncbi:Copper amine oxidase N-terminal domain-containing protein [Psychrobacillus sp. OK028]|uniref:stalk domain-containing protein n=1 Tax=Psychrobacillus sp. OK028 TaxID=1884359 RepID=UPI00088DBF21|nr:stalk domain-containing protein [Psychrobacillus sp. OK028]SDM36113.1 Copper amine oxidase N-terminal domain-containing protein [Psychrobacillus sp. OK028]
MKKFILGFLTAAMFFGTVGTYAATNSKIDVLWNVKAIKFDGVPKTSTNKPFVYNGATYVPLKFIGENFGKEVVWDRGTQSVLVNTPKPKGTYLGDTVKNMNYQQDDTLNGAQLVYNGKEIFNKNMSERTTAKNNLGTSYKNFLFFYISDWAGASTDFMDFPLSSKYKQFSATVGLDQTYQDTTSAITVEFLLDGNVIKTLEFKAGDFPQDINLSVENGKKLTLQVTTDDAYDKTSILFGNPFLK